tara:strand:- start:1058 stop:1531 length:474 start_codon:yes stop_codon:yes gene_type:complete
MQFRIDGADALQRKLKESSQRLAGPVRDFFNRSTRHIRALAAKGTPVDTGVLRSRWTTRIDASPMPTWGAVANPTKYGAFVEHGSRPHWPPLDAMQPWARRHGFPAGRAGAFLVARSIARRGTKGAHMLENAVKDSTRTLKRFVGIMGREIGRRFER